MGPWLSGRLLRSHRAVARQLAHETLRGEQARAEDRERAIARERARIAGELHDVLAHNLSAIVVQAGAARRVLDGDPQAAGEAARVIADTGRRRWPSCGICPGRCAVTSPTRSTARYEPSEVVLEIIDDGAGASAEAGLVAVGGGHGIVGMRERVGLYGVRLVTQGEALLAPSATRRLIHEFARTSPAPRELEVFRLIARGRSNAEIAGELYVGETTVKTHVTRILMKLVVRDRVQAVVLAYESGIVAPGDDA